MRAALIDALSSLAERDPRVLLLTGDLGFMFLERFRDRFPDRFINAGVAEQNMLGVATGLAKEGFVPFVYSIAPFALLRPFEFIRNGPVMHRLPVRIVGVGGGFEYGVAGPSHFMLEDLALTAALPAMTVVSPADATQVAPIIEQTKDLTGPLYLRLGKNDERRVGGLEGRFTLAEPLMLRQGSEVLVVTCGAIASSVAMAVDELAKEGSACGLLLLSTLNPVSHGSLLPALHRYGTIVTVETHYQRGGLGSLIAEALAGSGTGARLVSVAVEPNMDGHVGSQAYMEDAHGMSVPKLKERLKSIRILPN